MEFQEFWKHKKRMCDKYECPDCPIHHMNSNEFSCESWILRNPKKAEKIIEEWAKEHPAISNADRFKEIFGFEPDKNFCVIEKSRCPEGSTVCQECYYYGWWLQEYKEAERGD